MDLGSAEKFQWRCKNILEDSEDLNKIPMDKTYEKVEHNSDGILQHLVNNYVTHLLLWSLLDI